jgi:hypothetical protein
MRHSLVVHCKDFSFVSGYSVFEQFCVAFVYAVNYFFNVSAPLQHIFFEVTLFNVTCVAKLFRQLGKGI